MKLNYTCLLFLIVCFSCKKEAIKPIPGKVILNDIPGKYSGYFSTEMKCRHWITPKDTQLFSSIYFYNIPTNLLNISTSEVTSVNVNGSDANFYNDYNYNVWLDVYYPDYYKKIFKNLFYTVSSAKFGNFYLEEKQVWSGFSNSTAIPLSFSNSNPYSVTLSNLTNCTGIQIMFENGTQSILRTVLPSSPTAKFYASEFLDSSPGTLTAMNILLVNSKDTVINGYTYKLEKVINHEYRITFTN